MGAEKTPMPDSNFYMVREHKMRQNVKEEHKDADSKSETKDGKTYFYNEYDKLTGMLRGVMVNEEENAAGKKWKVLWVRIQQGAEINWLQMFFSSREADSFLKRLPNVDLTKEVTIKTMKTEDNKKKGKFHTMINVYQKGVKAGDTQESDIIVPYFWNKENPGKLPRLEKKTVKGQEVWDNSEMLSFYEKMITEKQNEITNVVRVTKGMDVKPEQLVFTENAELGIKICTGFEGAPFEAETTQQ